VKLIANGWIWRGAATGRIPVPENILIEGGRIVAVGLAPAPEGVEVIDAAGMLVMPGLVNAHFHSPVNHMKGRLPSLPLELFMLYESPSLEILRPSPREAYVRTLLACMEMLRSGVTAVQDDAFFVPHPEPAIIDAVAQAYEDSGIRARLALDQSNLPELAKLPYIGALLSPDQREALARPPAFGTVDLLACYDHLIDRWNGAAGGRVRAAVSCSAPQRVSSDYAAGLQRLSERHDLPFYVHILETRTQRAFGEERLGGRSLVRLADELGILTPHANVIHAIWVDDADLDLIATRGAAVAHNPISNLRLGSGVMRFRAIRDRGIPVALGTDEAIADDAVNMWAVAKMTGLIHNIGHPDYATWPTALEVLDCLIAGGHLAMRNSGIGAIAPGQIADLCLVDLDTLAFTPLNDLHRQLVYCETGSSVRLTMVAGRVVFADGAVTTLDEAALRAEARTIAADRREALEAAAALVEPLRSAYREMYLRAARRDVGMNRWVGGEPERCSNPMDAIPSSRSPERPPAPGRMARASRSISRSASRSMSSAKG
jgi:cytosine/adenosine deaminase-related metal-dependent hydrolase